MFGNTPCCRMLLPVLTFASLQVGAFAQSTTNVFPQFVDGAQPDGSSWQSFLYVTNPSSLAITCNISLYGGLGLDRLSVPPSFTMGANTWRFLSTTGKGSLASGYARLDCQLPVTAAVIYKLISGNQTALGAATVFSSAATSATAFPVLTFPGYRTALAVVNDNDTAARFRITFTDGSGREQGQIIQLEAKGRYVHFLDEIVALSTASGLGTIGITSQSGPLFNATGLLFIGNTFSTLVPFF